MKPSFLFVSHTTRVDRPYFDPSTRYRSFHLAEELARRGFSSQVTSLDFFEKEVHIADGYDYIVFHRPRVTPRTADFFVKNEKSDAIIADFDDLIFDVALSDVTPAVRVRKNDPVQNRVNLASFAAACAMFSTCTTSTTPLRDRMVDLFGIARDRAHVVPNCIDAGFLGICNLARRGAAAERPYQFGYFSGTQSRDLDLQVAGAALAKAMRADKRAKLLVVGPVDIPSELADYSDRITRRPLVAFHELPFLKASVKMVIAPLEDTEFNRAKSGLKFWEAALVGCTVAATPIPDIDRFDSPLLKKCTTPDDWNAALQDTAHPSPVTVEQEVQRIADLVSIERCASSWLRQIVGGDIA